MLYVDSLLLLSRCCAVPLLDVFRCCSHVHNGQPVALFADIKSLLVDPSEDYSLDFLPAEAVKQYVEDRPYNGGVLEGPVCLTCCC